MPSFSRNFLPGRLLNTVTAFLAIFVLVIASAFTITIGYFRENWIVLHAGVTVLSAIILKITLLYDPRKPLGDYFWMMYERKFCIFLHLLENLVLWLWLWSVNLPKLEYQNTVETVAVFAIVISRFICFIWFYYKEHNEQYDLAITFAMAVDFLFLLDKTCIILTILLKSNQKFVDVLLFLYNYTYPVYTVFILAVFSGLFRESVRQLPVQVQLPVRNAFRVQVQLPLPVELERQPSDSDSESESESESEIV
jgi:hypothetical protein